jgi:hypothetical protein
MEPPLLLQRLIRFLALTCLAGLVMAEVSAADATAAGSAPAKSSTWNLSDFIDGLPDILSERLPSFDPDSAVRLYARPHLGDFLHRDYLRLPIGARIKPIEDLENTVELQTYFTHGLSDAAGYGLSGLRLGSKYDHVLPSINDGAGISVGFNYQTPLSRPPLDLTDGHRHFQPYISGTRPIMPEWKLLGFAGFGADILDRTAIPANFGRNQLHSNSIGATVGVAREFARFRGTLTAAIQTSSLISDENKYIYSLRPEIVFPWKMRQSATTQILITLGGRAIHGPDGTDLGVSSSVRFEFRFRRNRAK